MERADEQDLMDATAQGSIVQIYYLDGEKYGKGGFYKRFQFPRWSKIVATIMTTFMVISMMIYFVWRKYNLAGKSSSKRLNKQLGRRKVVAPLEQELHSKKNLPDRHDEHEDEDEDEDEDEVEENAQQTAPSSQRYRAPLSSQRYRAPLSFNHNLRAIDQLTHAIQNEIADDDDLGQDTPMTRFRTL